MDVSDYASSVPNTRTHRLSGCQSGLEPFEKEAMRVLLREILEAVRTNPLCFR